jgi:subtilase family serine protease
MKTFGFSRRSVLAAAVAGVTVLGLAAAGAGTASASSSSGPARHYLTGSTPGWLSHAHAEGTTSSSETVGFGVLLNIRDESGAVSELESLSEPSSASYGKWLSNAQFDERYGPTKSTVTAVQDWLRGEGFRVTQTLPSGMYVEASGTASQVEKVFGTQLKNYSYEGKSVRANTGELSLPSDTPAAVTGSVAGIVGIDQGSILKEPTDTMAVGTTGADTTTAGPATAGAEPADTLPGPPPGARYGVQPCSSYYGQKTAANQPSAYGAKQPYAVCGYTPQQYEGAYGDSSLLRSGVTGKGITVAITDAYASPTMLADAQEYSKVHGEPEFRPGQYTQITPGADGYDDESDCGPQGWYGEETLDVEAVHAMAPGAKIVYVGAADCESSLDDAWASAIDNHVANVITNSWTDNTDDLSELGTSYVQFYEQYSLEAALTGITVNFSTGDDGDGTSGGTDLADKTVGFPSDLPYVTGVGGTSVEIGGRNQWLGEYGWQNDYSQLSDGTWSPAPPGVYSSGGTGGTSELFTQPFYQKGKVPASVSEYWGSTPMRAVPDIAVAGDPNTGFLVGETQVFPNGTYWDQYRIGGTSLSSPLMAGMVAVADQYTHRSLGFVNPLYYDLQGTSALHDIVAPRQPVAQVRTNYANNVDSSDGYTYELETIDVQSSTLHDTKGYDDETGVGSPDGRSFFNGLLTATKER